MPCRAVSHAAFSSVRGRFTEGRCVGNPLDGGTKGCVWRWQVGWLGPAGLHRGLRRAGGALRDGRVVLRQVQKPRARHQGDDHLVLPQVPLRALEGIAAARQRARLMATKDSD